MTTPTNALAAAVREAMNYGSRALMLVALHRALAAHDAAQPSEATHTRHTLYLARHDGDWIGYPGPDWNHDGRPVDILGKLHFYWPRPTPPPEVEGAVEDVT